MLISWILKINWCWTDTYLVLCCIKGSSLPGCRWGLIDWKKWPDGTQINSQKQDWNTRQDFPLLFSPMGRHKDTLCPIGQLGIGSKVCCLTSNVNSMTGQWDLQPQPLNFLQCIFTSKSPQYLLLHVPLYHWTSTKCNVANECKRMLGKWQLLFYCEKYLHWEDCT